MDASETGKAPQAKTRKTDARETRLAQALRANLRRRKGSEPPSKPKETPEGPN